MFTGMIIFTFLKVQELGLYNKTEEWLNKLVITSVGRLFEFSKNHYLIFKLFQN
jgi:uncharacterized membrane protein